MKEADAIAAVAKSKAAANRAAKTLSPAQLESAAANKRAFLMGLQPVESVLALTRQHPYHRRRLRIV